MLLVMQKLALYHVLAGGFVLWILAGCPGVLY